MKIRSIPSTIAAGLLLMLAVPFATQAAAPAESEFCGQPPPMGKPHQFDSGELPPHLQRLNLSADQHAKVTALLKEREPALQEKAKTGWKTHNDLRNLALSDNYTPEKAKVFSEAGARTMAEVTLMHASLDNAIYQILTPEQQQQFKQPPVEDGPHGPRHH
ncbi:Spy/CpxP family protein refolding chaperone [Candidatus Methylospira mobilis]|uniref:Spy/CpxP family protein refolding chaperone n=1 Tax=Candidatus Methylospira mobilis TaxID=1808979 RepID=UPI001884D27F|nr:Spy/CpxP family protein refolding chaperone [Candidatus Methylospira mobilis]